MADNTSPPFESVSALDSPAAALRAVQEQLRDADERMNLALRSAGVGTWNWNVGEDIVTWDEHMHPLFGLAPGGFGGTYQDFVDYLHPNDRQRVETEVAAAVHGDAAYDTEFRVVWPDKAERVIHAKGKVYRSADQQPLRMTGVCWDVTGRVRAAAEIQDSQKKLEQANEELRQFAYVASHDLREPLRTVRSFCELFNQHYQGQLDAQADKWLNFMVDATSHMQQLIDDLLMYSRLESRAHAPQATDCNEVMHHVIQLLDLSIQESQSTVTFSDLPTVRAESTQLSQLFQNLISNAIKYRREQPRIHISAERTLKSWKFAVHDNGIGIKEEFFEKVFELFKRLHPRNKYSGTGIGLAICRKIVHRHGGEIWLESQFGEGTTFYFTIPDDESEHDS